MKTLAYGEHWMPDLVDWDVPECTLGRLPGRAHPIGAVAYDVDVWDASAYFVLWSHERAVYVGKATEERKLGSRLRDHVPHRVRDGWVSFSWYSISELARSAEVESSRNVMSDSPQVADSGYITPDADHPFAWTAESLSGATLVEQRPALSRISDSKL